MKICIFFLLISICTFSYAGNTRLNINIGKGDINLSQDFQFEDSGVGKDSLAYAVYFGYVTDNNLIFDVGINKVTDDFPFLLGLTDNLHFDSYEAMFGYQFRYGHAYVEPKLGYSNWKINLDEGWLLNPGAEESIKDNGSDIFFMATAGYRFVKTFGLSVSYKYQDFDHGKTKSILIGFDLAF